VGCLSGKKAKRSAESTKLPKKRGSDASRFISHLLCADFSADRPVPGDWSVGQLLTMAKPYSAVHGRRNDGVFALRLVVKACSPQGQSCKLLALFCPGPFLILLQYIT
jgi:hypothetical protein